ncbi:UPF0489 family protein [bacterium]|nr:UPF0489 family protein [bacterium]
MAESTIYKTLHDAIPPKPCSCDSTSVAPEIWVRLLQSGHYSYETEDCLSSIYHPKKSSSNAKTNPLTPIIVGGVDQICGETDYMRRSGQSLYTNVRIEEPGHPPIYVMGDHDTAFFAWEEARQMGYVDERAVLIHIDQHSDSIRRGGYDVVKSYPREDPGYLSLIAAFYLYGNICIGSFILPALVTGTVGEFWFFKNPPSERLGWDRIGRLFDDRANSFMCARSLDSVLHTSVREGDRGVARTILDIDLDGIVGVYASGEPTQAEKERIAENITFLAEISRYAGVITIATSPGFADQRIAIQTAKDLVEAILER